MTCFERLWAWDGKDSCSSVRCSGDVCVWVGGVGGGGREGRGWARGSHVQNIHHTLNIHNDRTASRTLCLCILRVVGISCTSGRRLEVGVCGGKLCGRVGDTGEGAGVDTYRRCILV